MGPYFEYAALIFGGLFTGVAGYILFVEHPARLAAGVESAVSEFKSTYRRGAAMQITLAAVGFCAGTGAWLNGSHWAWLVGGVLLGTVVPFTLFTMFPTNRRLLDPNLYKLSYETTVLLRRWGRLHAIRTALGTAALVLFLVLFFAPWATG